MEDVIGGLLLLAIGFLIWAAIGHGIWLLIGAAWSALFSSNCPRCGAKLASSGPCERCDAALKNAPPKNATVASDLAAARRLLAYAQHQQWVSESQSVALSKLLDRLALRLHSKPVDQLISPSPSPANPVVPSVEPQIARASDTDDSSVIVEATLVKPLALDRPLPPAMPQTDAVHQSSPTAGLPHPLDAPEPPPQPTRAPVSQRVAGDLLRSFMEQSNIRWVELISGALIVVCSVGLVISLWSTLSQTSRLFPSLVFLLATAAVHGAGQYTLRKWKLRSTSRGVLHIGLMLIPLAILVGILLARREGAGAALETPILLGGVVGLLVYGALALTACRTLFLRQWQASAAAVIIPSFSLAAIYLVHQFWPASPWLANVTLAPTVGVAMWLSLTASRMSLHRRNISAAVGKRLLGMVVQGCFAAAVVAVFWILASNRHVGLGWWLVIGLWSTAWASWGWATGLAKVDLGWSHEPARKNGRPPRSQEAGWVRIAAWAIAACAATLLVIAILHLGSSRWAIAGFLMVAAAWLGLHASFCGSRSSLFLSVLCAVIGLAIGLEFASVRSVALLPTEWLSFPRVFLLTSLGLVTAVIGAVLARDGESPADQERKRSRFSLARGEIGQLVTAAALTAVALGIALTIMASIAPVGPTPLGGNWAGILLFAYGWLAIAVGIYASRNDSINRLRQSVLPIGQALVLLAVVRLFQTSPMLEPWLAQLRPSRAWGFGLALVGLLWATLAACVRMGRTQRGQRLNILSLSYGALAVSIVGLPAVWGWDERFLWAAWVGWYLPAVCWALFLATRQPIFRESTLLALFGWLATAVFYAGYVQQWWVQLGLGSSTAIFTLIASSLVLAYHRALNGWARQQPASASAEEPHWSIGGNYWADAVLIVCGWLGMFYCLAPAVAAHTGLSLGWGGEVIETRLPAPHPIIALLAISLLAAVGAWVGKTRERANLRILVALLPLASACIAITSVAPPYSLAAGLWVLAAWLLASELLSAARNDWPQMSSATWERLFNPTPSASPVSQWLLAARGLTLSLLIACTILFLLTAFTGRASSELLMQSERPWLWNMGRLFWSLGPVISVTMVRWSMGAIQGASVRLVVTPGAVAATMVGCWCALSIDSEPVSRSIVFLQGSALLLAWMGWKTVGYSSFRNYVGLKRLAGGKLSARETLLRAMKGRRWLQSESASWAFVAASMSLIVVQALAAAGVVFAYPALAMPEGVLRLGGFLTLFLCGLALPVFWWQAARRHVSHFGLLAVVLAILAPILSVHYIGWLVARPQWTAASAAGFEPIRLVIALWLLALAIGLGIRWIATQRGASFTRVGEKMWVALATVVGLAGLMSTIQDPNPWWPSVELSLLAGIVALSGVVSGRVLRGHWAAVLAAAALCAWLFHQPIRDMHQPWGVLWGPVWVALLTLASRQVWQYYAREPFAALATRGGAITVDQSTSLLMPLVSGGLTFIWIASQNRVVQPSSVFAWGILGLSVATLVLAIGRLWDARSFKRGLAFYLSVINCALVAAMCLCSAAELPKLQSWLLWMGSGIGAMALMAALTRELLREASRLGPALGLQRLCTPGRLRHALSWMPAVHTLAGVLLLVPSLLLVLAFPERPLRIAATSLPFVAALAVLPIALERGKQLYRYCGLIFISTSLVLLSWADLPSAWAMATQQDLWIYLQRAFVSLVALGVVYPALVAWQRPSASWQLPLMHCGWLAMLLGAAFAALMLLFQLDEAWKVQAATATGFTKALTIIGWAAVVVRLLQFAVNPHSIDRRASVRLRSAAVYGAELGLALLCAASYFHFPELFSGLVAEWWPLVVFAIAMFSAALGEWLKRLGQTIVADPVAQSSLLLPIIPLTAVWFLQPDSVGWLWRDWSRYSLLLFTAACLYGLQGWQRRSLPLQSVSAALCLLAFWSLLHSQPDLRFIEHPQFWLLPPALATLMFVELRREQLDPGMVVATRYIALLIAYLSSTAEVFLRNFEGQIWQPLVLLIVALLGVAAGILLRVRAFLYCGASFTFVALLAMVWHAQQAIGEVWPWWTFGIVTGVTLIVLLGYFEKNRPRVLAYLDGLKQWEK